jgi:hypothetical protein
MLKYDCIFDFPTIIGQCAIDVKPQDYIIPLTNTGDTPLAILRKHAA